MTAPLTQKERAVAMVRELLEEHPEGFLAQEAHRRGDALGVSRPTLNRARKELRLKYKSNGNRPGFWVPAA